MISSPEASLTNEVESLLSESTVSAAERLKELSDGPNKEIAKAARRALYKLKQAGIQPPPVQAILSAPQPTRKPQYATRAWISGHTGLGTYLLIFLRDDPYGGSPTVISILIDQGKGVVGLKGRKLPLRSIEENIKSVAERDNTVLADAPADFAKYLLVQALEVNTRTRSPIPEGFSNWNQQIGPPEREYLHHPIFDLIDAESVRSDLSISRDPFALFEHKPFTGWVLEPSSVDPWEEKYFDSQQSILALDKTQIEQRGESIIDEAADALLDSSALKDLRSRLEHVAYVLHLNNESERSCQALFHALSISDTLPPHTQAFPRAFVKRSIYVVIALKAEQEPEANPPEPSSLIARV
jgi:hypothetical protein